MGNPVGGLREFHSLILIPVNANLLGSLDGLEDTVELEAGQ
jgi:hypothetical protein